MATPSTTGCQDYARINPNRTDTFAPAGGQSLLRLIPCIAQLNGWKLENFGRVFSFLMTGYLAEFFLDNVKVQQNGSSI